MSYKIAVIDDNPDDIFVIKRMLLKANKSFIIDEFIDPEIALDNILNDTIDCIIVDYNLPKMNGIEFVSKFNNKYKSDVLIIFLTGQGSEKIAAESLKSGAHDYIIKNELSSEILYKSIIKGIEKRDFERKEKTHKEFVEKIIELIPTPLFYKDKNGIFLGGNKAFEEILGKSKEDFIGKTVYEILKEEDAINLSAKDKELLEKPSTQNYESEFIDKNGETKYLVNNRVTYNNSFGEVDGIIGIIIDVTESKKKEIELSEKSYMDGLTKMYNRRYFDEISEKEWKNSIRENIPLSLLMIDVDYFKKFNDKYGHQEGDNCLKKVAESINKSLLRPTDSASRYGGEEFVVILSNTGEKGAREVAERIRKNILEQQIPHEDSLVNSHVTISIGISEKISKTDTIFECIKRADTALYQAKENGRNRVEFFMPPI